MADITAKLVAELRERTSAFLQSIMPAPVRSRSSLTRVAVISAIANLDMNQCKAGLDPP